jgi:hypothetical protein
MSPMGRGSRKGRGSGASRSGGRKDAGPGGECECSKCGHRIPHQTGKPCLDIPCPKCGSQMIRREK